MLTDSVTAKDDQSPAVQAQDMPTVHDRFPFNQDLESELGTTTVEKDQAQTKETQMPKETSKELPKNQPRKISLPKQGRRRHLSMSDIRSTITPQTQSLVSKPSSRFKELGRRMRSPSPAKTSAAATPVTSRTWLGKATPAPRLPFRSSLKRSCDQKDTTVEVVEVPAPASMPILASSLRSRSTTPLPRLLSNALPDPPAIVETATPAKPLFEFQGGAAWFSFSRTRTTLGLDLFWPCGDDEDDMPCLSIVEMRPLCQFRRLRSLKLVGMMQSYQTFIWQAAWLNLGLEELELGMALEPEIASHKHKAQWKLIQEGWTMDKKQTADPVY